VAEKNKWYYGIKIVAVLKSALAVVGFTPVATYLIVGYYDKSTLDFKFLIWAVFWLLYLWNATSIFRLQKGSRNVSISFDLVYVVLYWKAFIDVGVSLSLLSMKALHGLLPFAFITYLLLSQVKAQFQTSKS
jgi:hypothetical protein